MCKVIIFAGTTEGRELALYLEEQEISTYVCTATAYGKSLIHESAYLEVSGQRLNEEEMEQLFREKAPVLVVDATHPYATVVSSYIKEACMNVDISYIRLLREKTEDLSGEADVIYVNSVEEACAYLDKVDGNIFVTTGSKELKEYTRIDNYKERVYARVLSSKEAMNQVMDLGFEGKNLICMQGPFSEELNYIMLKESNSKYLVTKEAGRNGGFLEKVNAANCLNIKTIVIGRPTEEEGYSYSQVIELLNERKLKDVTSREIKKEIQLQPSPRKIAVIGIGMGNQKGMTGEAIKEMEQSDIIFGAKRMLDCAIGLKKQVVELYKKEEISAYLAEHLEYRKIAVLVSGDVGFYSAANQFDQYFKNDMVYYICGISSLVYFCSKIKKSWQKVKPISNHGKKVNTIEAVRKNQQIFSLMGGNDSVRELMQELITYRLVDVKVWVGENLGYEKEKITYGLPTQLVTGKFDALCVVYIENEKATEEEDRIKDEEFIRGEVPMTKEEIRTVSISKLELKSNSILYDIGAGTGSVSIQAARKIPDGMVYAIERKADAVALIKENKMKFQISNVKVVEGIAPDALGELPIPTHAFIGGSGGNLGEMIRLLKSKNPLIRIVITAITLETITEAITVLKELSIVDYEIVQMQCARAKKAGTYHMMMGQNPVTMITIE